MSDGSGHVATGFNVSAFDRKMLLPSGITFNAMVIDQVVAAGLGVQTEVLSFGQWGRLNVHAGATAQKDLLTSVSRTAYLGGVELVVQSAGDPVGFRLALDKTNDASVAQAKVAYTF